MTPSPPDEQVGTGRPGPFTIVRALIDAKIESGDLSLDRDWWEQTPALIPEASEALRDAGFDADRDLVGSMLDEAACEIDREKTFAAAEMDDPTPEVVHRDGDRFVRLPRREAMERHYVRVIGLPRRPQSRCGHAPRSGANQRQRGSRRGASRSSARSGDSGDPDLADSDEPSGEAPSAGRAER